MRQRINSRFANGLLAIALCGLAPVAAQAQAANDTWQWELGIYAWLPAIGATTEFPSGASGPSLDVSAEDVIESLKMTFMGQVEARKGQWGVWSDLVYADLGGTNRGSRDFTVDGQPVSASAKLSLDMKSTVWSLASSIPELPTRSGEASVDGTNWDAIVGLKGRYYFGAERKWFLPYYADAGSGQSKLTWQINAGVGYKFDWGSVLATWRYLDYEFKSGNAMQSMNMNGGLVGVAFQF
jgi:hypothetical protein